VIEVQRRKKFRKVLDEEYNKLKMFIQEGERSKNCIYK